MLAPHYKYRRDIVPKSKAISQPTLEHDDQDSEADRSTKQRMHWARLLKRVFAIDVETCPGCQGRVRIIVAIEDPRVIKKNPRAYRTARLGLRVSDCASRTPHKPAADPPSQGATAHPARSAQLDEFAQSWSANREFDFTQPFLD